MSSWSGFVARLAVFAVFLAIMVFILTSCAAQTPPVPEPIIVTKEVERIVQVRCMDMRPPAPKLPDDDIALAAVTMGDIFRLAQIYRAARALYRQRLMEDDGQIAACVGGGQ